MDSMVPMAAILKKSFELTFSICLLKKKYIHKIRAVSSIRHHTSQPSLSEISLPKIPVKPHRKTAVCKRIKADLIEQQRKCKIGNCYCASFKLQFAREEEGK